MKHKLIVEIWYTATCPDEVYSPEEVHRILVSELDQYGMMVNDVVVKEDKP